MNKYGRDSIEYTTSLVRSKSRVKAELVRRVAEDGDDIHKLALALKSRHRSCT